MSGVMRVKSRDFMTAPQVDVNQAPAETRSAAKQEIKKDDEFGTMDVYQLCLQFGTDAERGMNSAAAAKRLQEDGPNELEKPVPPGLALLFVLQLTNIIIVLLIGAAFASFAVNSTKADVGLIDYVEGCAILMIVILNALIAAVTENDANNALDALSKMSQASSDCIRDGVVQQIASNQLVKGDIIVLGTGDVAPADIRLMKADELKVNEMLLTGEPDDVAKRAEVKKHSALTPPTMVFSSCMCTNGKATGVIVETGMRTRVGKIAAMLTTDQKTKCGCLPDMSGNQTPLQHNLHTLSVQIGYMALAVCLGVFFVGWGLGRTDPAAEGQPSWLFMILISVTLAVAAIPEGIPLCVTISLSKGCSSMVERNVLVRKLAAVETLGSASVICTDKTGTLTEGKMRMVKCYGGGNMYSVSGTGFNPTVGEFKAEPLPGTEGRATVAPGTNGNTDAVVRSTIFAGYLCSNCTVSQNKEGMWEPFGNNSEAPITVAAGKLGFWVPKDESKNMANNNRRVLEIPFSSARKMMLTVQEATEKIGPAPAVSVTPGSRYIVICKGAPNFILESCATWTKPDGTVVPLTAKDKEDTFEIIDKLSDMALRVLAIAVRFIPELPYDPKDDEIDAEKKFQLLKKDLQLLGLVASIDPARQGVPEAVADANMAHIRVVMITGDYLKTAVAIAKDINILRPQDNPDVCAVDSKGLRPGEDNEYLPDGKIDALTAKTRVFARAQPEDKLKIVESLQRQNKVVAMTGDGVNDAPALNRADIGVAMGIQGTEVAKGAADMILTDDNFCNIVGAVEKGRVIYAGIQKFVAFIMSVHMGEVVQIFFCIVVGVPVMRTPLQILFLILVTDLPPSIALGMEPGQPGILEDYPRPKEQAIVLSYMWQGIVVNGSLLSLVAIVCFMYSLQYFIGTAFNDGTADCQCVCTGILPDPITYKVDSALSYLIPSDAPEPPMGWPDNCVANAACGITQIIKCTGDQGVGAIGLIRARTTAFVCVVFCENIRAYTSRSFDSPVYKGCLDNKAMQRAIFMAQVCLYIVIFTPVLSDTIMTLGGTDLLFNTPEGFIFAVIGAIACLALCEMYKVIVAIQVKSFKDNLRKKLAAEGGDL
jgi:magnesium-transporting ATPase (P-type)